MSLRRLLPLLLLVLAFQAPAAEPPVIASIDPETSSTTGGFPVTINGSHLDLPAGFACIVPCPPRVRFGDTEMAAHDYTNERLVVLAPPHAAGNVDVTVITGDGRTVTRGNGFTYTSSPEDAWEKVLLPVYNEKQIPGSAGSLWETQFRLRNGGSTAVEIAPLWCDLPCPPVYPSRLGIAPGETLTKLPPASPDASEGRGRLFFLTKHAAGDVSIQARVADLSRGRVDAGTEIPIVRSSQLHGNAMQLLNVPFDPGPFRYRLRIYETANVPSAFRVRVFTDQVSANPGPLLEMIVQTRSKDPQPEFRSEPFAYETELGPLLLPVLASGTVRIEVAPEAAYSRAWAMLTITSVDGNHVTLVTPQ